MFKYSVYSAWSDEDGGYIATISEFPGLSGFGETIEEAVEEAKIAAEGFIEVYEEDGEDLPEPIKVSAFSGQTRLRIPKSLHASLSQEAQTEGVSLNTYIVQLLSERNSFKKVERKLEDMGRSLVEYGTSEGAWDMPGGASPGWTEAGGATVIGFKAKYDESGYQFPQKPELTVIN